MRIPKRYGQSRTDKCVFCGKRATTESKEKVPVCQKHKNATLPPLRCLCGEYVSPMSGKWGLYFNCLRCGNVNARRILDNNRIYDASEKQTKKESKKKQVQWRPKPPTKTNKKPKEIEITTDDVEYF